MNEANVKALARLLNDDAFPAPLDAAWCREMAQFLAARGVLVPSALTQDDIAAGRGLFGGIEWSVAAAEVASLLERIAKGEPRTH